MKELDYYTAGLLDSSISIGFEADRTVLYVRGIAVPRLRETWGGSLRGSTLRISSRKSVEGLLLKWRELPTRRDDEIYKALDHVRRADMNELSI